MSITTIQIFAEDEFRFSDPSQVSIVEGETIEFKTLDEAGTTVLFSAETTLLLSPTPALQVDIAGRSSVSYTFKAPAALSYLCQLFPSGAGPLHLSQEAPFSASAGSLTILPSPPPEPPPPPTALSPDTIPPIKH